MRIALVGGGSGGHFYPLIAIAEALLARAREEGAKPPSLYYIGPEPYDTTALNQFGITFISCPSGKLRRYGALGNILTPFMVFGGILVAIIKLFRIYPDALMSKGGYTSVPVVLAAAFLRIPIIIHESDAVPGRANLLASRYARYIAISYPDAMSKFHHGKDRIALTGIPLRSTPVVPVTTSGERPIIAIFGGSQGALRVNNLILESLAELLATYDVVHQTGSEHEPVVREMAKGLVPNSALLTHYRPVGFVPQSEMTRILTSAALVISRAGSGTIAEIARAGKPAILIPIPEDVSHDQLTNAYAYARTGAATVLEEKNLTPHLLIAEIERILKNDDVRARMVNASQSFVFPHAADTLARALIDIGKEHGSYT